MNVLLAVDFIQSATIRVLKLLHICFLHFFRYGTVNFNSMRKWICASFITNHLKVL